MGLVINIGYPVDSHETLLARIRALPTEFVPRHFSTSEQVTDKKNLLSDDLKFSEFLQKSKRVGFTLVGEKISYHVSPTTYRDHHNIPTHGYIYVEIKRGFKYQDRIDQLFFDLIDTDGIEFGYMCEHDESQHRHRFKKTWNSNQSGARSIELTIGTDFNKYAPGLYWRTVFANDYLARHGVEIEFLDRLALKIEPIDHRDPGGKNVYTFFDTWAQWPENQLRLDNAIASNESFFSMSRIGARVESVSSQEELMAALSRFT